MERFRIHADVMLQITRDAFISSAIAARTGEICMISMYSQIVRPCPMLFSDARVAL
jgi:hypothetical protein